MGCSQEPVRGWTDNIYGPFGIMIGVGLGLVRVLYIKDVNVTDIVPVDMVANCLIIAGVNASKRDIRNEEMQIYNLTSSNQNPLTWGSFHNWLFKFADIYASVQTIYIYITLRTTNDFLYNLFINLFHIVPAHIIDVFLRLRGQKPRVVKLYEKIHKLVDLLKYFGSNEWRFYDDNTQKLFNSLSVRDQILYNFDIKDLNWDEYLFHSVRAVRVHLLKDPLSTIPQAQKKIKILTVAHYTLMFVLLAILGSFFYFLYWLLF